MLTVIVYEPVCGFCPAAMVFGSLHFHTFDGTEYTFKALGEFVLLRLSTVTGSNVFTLQGQTDRLHVGTGGPMEVPVVVRLAAFHQGIGKVNLNTMKTLKPQTEPGSGPVLRLTVLLTLLCINCRLS